MVSKYPPPEPQRDPRRPQNPAIPIVPLKTLSRPGHQAAEIANILLEQVTYLLLLNQARAYAEPGSTGVPAAEMEIAMHKTARAVATLTVSLKRIQTMFAEDLDFTQLRTTMTPPALKERFDAVAGQAWRHVNGDPEGEDEVRKRVFEKLDRMGAETRSSLAREERYQRAMEAALRRLDPTWPDRDSWHAVNPPPDEVPEADRHRFTDAWEALRARQAAGVKSGQQSRHAQSGDQFGSLESEEQHSSALSSKTGEQFVEPKTEGQTGSVESDGTAEDWWDTSHLPPDLETKSAAPPEPLDAMIAPHRGAPIGNRNAWKTGRYSAAARRLRAETRRDLRAARALARLVRLLTEAPDDSTHRPGRGKSSKSDGDAAHKTG